MPALRFTLRSPERYLNVEDYRRAARKRVPKLVWDFVDGGADDLTTLRDNRDAYARWALRWRVLTGHHEPSLATTVAGVPLELPILLAPTGTLGLSSWTGDLAAARAAEAAGTRLVLSTASSWTIEEVAEGAAESHFFQLYAGGELTGPLLQRAWNAGYRAVFVTVDVPVIGNREGERRTGFARRGALMTDRRMVVTPRVALDFARHPRWLYRFFRHGRSPMRNLTAGSGVSGTVDSVSILHREIERARMDWDDLAWVREQWPGKVFVKGVLDPEDALRCASLGMDGVVVSNHGGRQLDFALSSLDALPAVVDAVGDRLEVLLDGGIRRGTDVIKALALGARAVLIGRPLVYGLIVGGQQGVTGVLDLLREELERDLILMGAPGIDALDRTWLLPRPGA